MNFMVLFLLALFLVFMGSNFTGSLNGPAILTAKIMMPNYYDRRPAKVMKEVDLCAFSRRTEEYITQGYGPTLFATLNAGYLLPRHNGIDLAAAQGAPIYSPWDGKVLELGNQDDFCPKKGYGKFVLIRNMRDGYAILYAHLSSISLKEEQFVKSGEFIGRVGATGYATASHLHLSVFKTDSLDLNFKNGCGPDPHGIDINPIDYFKI